MEITFGSEIIEKRNRNDCSVWLPYRNKALAGQATQYQEYLGCSIDFVMSYN